MRTGRRAPRFLSNNAGGILGGISTGQEVVVRFAVKPTSSILTPRKSMDRSGDEIDTLTNGRHDPCVGIRAVPVGEAMMACVLADHLFRHRGQIGAIGRISTCVLVATTGKSADYANANPPYNLVHCSIVSAIFSAVISIGKFVLAHGTTGKIEASTTRRPCTPLTRPCVSTTAIGSSAAAHPTGAGGVPDADRSLAHEGFERVVVAHHVLEREAFDDEVVDHVVAQRRRPVHQRRGDRCEHLVLGIDHADLADAVGVGRRERLVGHGLQRRAHLHRRHLAEAAHQAVEIALVGQQVELDDRLGRADRARRASPGRSRNRSC